MSREQKNFTAGWLSYLLPRLLDENTLDPQTLGRLLLVSKHLLPGAVDASGLDRNRPSYRFLEGPLHWIFLDSNHHFSRRDIKRYEAYERRNPGRLAYPADTLRGKKLNILQMRIMITARETLDKSVFNSAPCWKNGLTDQARELAQNENHSYFLAFTDPANRRPWCYRALEGRRSLLDLMERGRLPYKLGKATELVEGGAFLEATDSKGLTLLEHAAQIKNIDFARCLLRHGADPLKTNALYELLWRWGVSSGDVDMLRSLQWHGEPPMGVVNDRKQSLLHIAVEKKHLEVARLLLEHPFSLTQEDMNQRAPLHWAAFNKDASMIGLFLSKKADVNIKNRYGKTALYYTVDGRDSRCTQLLLEGGADPNANEGDELPLESAVWDYPKTQENIALLLQHGADPEKLNKRGTTPLSAAAREGHLELVRLFESQPKPRESKMPSP